MFAGNYKQLKTISKAGIVFIFLCKRRNFNRMTINKRWLNQLLFYLLFKEFIHNMPVEHMICYFYIVFFCKLTSFFYTHLFPEVNTSVFFNGVNHMKPFPFRFKVHIILTVLNLSCS